METINSFIVVTIIISLIIMVASNFNTERKVLNERDKYLLWLDQRITELQKEYDSIIVFNDEEEFQIKLVKGGKLKAYKEVRDYISTH